MSNNIITGNWALVLLNIGFFLVFILFINYRKSIDWTSAGGYSIYTAFIVSLFVEMYGVPLTVFLGSGLVGAPSNPPSYLFGFDIFGVTIGLTFWYLAGLVITGSGILLIASGWWQVYNSGDLVTDRIYSYSRNPQYLGIILIALGWVIGWPTLLTLTLFPLVLYAYYRLSKVEEEDMLERYGEDYRNYMEEVPLLI
ncbi:MAG: DUF1295 domain-containing protein [Candidatus Nanohaloarchaeota archaeon QJJ-7]|nr:DUF1295 domain-containing protein [Candidatus Nanohaloarchaeota archaeon QJJ-7]